ncbi:MAG: Gfo/Idh/MocA family oxidoreductase [Gemmatimonadetes bacterium]|nr:Gfo/Idh/MocA family oxidoreductase [Gemmatimonadota bacterium]
MGSLENDDGPDRKNALRFAVIGTGAISQVVYVPILAERTDVDLAVVADLDVTKARSVAERFGIEEATGPEAVLTRPDLDAVVICTPNHLHEELAIAALEAGKHVLVERPMALTAEGVERILAAARSSGKALGASQAQRFRPEVAALRGFVAGGELGSIYAVRGSWLTRRVPVMRATWRHSKKHAGGGALMDLGVPSLDLCMWLVGYPRITRVSCVLTRGSFEVEDAATVMALSEDGIAFTLEVSSRYFAGEDRYYARVMGAEGSGSLPPLEVYKQLGGRPLEVTPRQPRPRGGENPYTNAHRRQLDQFVRAVSSQAEVPLPEEQVALMRVIQAAYHAAETRGEVTL